MALDRSKITVCWPNLVDRSTLSGGNFVDTLPLELAQDPTIAVRCKSADASLSSTWFDISLDKPRPFQCLAIAGHTFSASALYRVRIYSDKAQQYLIWDSEWQTVWPQLFATAELEWEYDNFWLGTISEDDRALYTPLLTVFSDEVALAESVRVEIDDQGNPDGCVRFGRVFLADAWQPDVNAAYGIQHGMDNVTSFEEAGDRTEYAEVKRQRRTVVFDLEELSEEEAYQRVFSMHRTQGAHGEVLYAFNLTDRPENFSRMFLARQRQVDPLSQPYYATHSATISLIEVL